MEASVTQYALMYFVLPVWLAPGFADYLCHRASCMAVRSGARESLIHLLMFVAVLVQAAIFLDINALVTAIFFLHKATALWDVSYATQTREVTPLEPHVHANRGALVPLRDMDRS